MKKAVVMLVVVLFGFALALGYARANPGAFDPTWGDEGVVLTDFSGMEDWGNAGELMPDGRLVVVGWANGYPGDYAVVRYLRDGRLDPSFGDGGRVATAFFDDPDLVDVAWAATARPDGGLYVFGETCDADYDICQFGLAAYNADGSLDESFGDGGLVVTNVDDVYSVYAWPTRNILQPDGKLVAGGVALFEDNNVDIVLIRYNPDGSLDESFGDGGISVTDLAGKANFTEDFFALPDGKIMVVGGFTEEYMGFQFTSDNAYMARFNSDGTLDTTFGGGDGYITWDYNGEPTIVEQAVLTSDGDIIAFGTIFDTTSDLNSGNCMLQRYSAEGEMDMEFGEDGWAIADSGLVDMCLHATLTPDGKIAFISLSFPPDTDELWAPVQEAMPKQAKRLGPVRAMAATAAFSEDESFDNMLGLYNPDGTPDASFADNGLLLFKLDAGFSMFVAVAAQQDGKLLAVGEVFFEDEVDIGVIRVLGDGPAAQVYAPMISR